MSSFTGAPFSIPSILSFRRQRGDGPEAAEGRVADRHKALVLAPMRGPGFEALKALADVVYEPFIEQKPLRLYSDEQLADRVRAEGATIVVCEGDRVGPATLDLPLLVVGATRGDPTNVDVAAATERGVPVLNAPG